MRALLVSMDRLAAQQQSAAASRYPQLANGTLVPAAKVAFPALPDVQRAAAVPAGPRYDGKDLPFLVPQVDSDGNELAGIRTPDIAVPRPPTRAGTSGTRRSAARTSS